MTDLHISKVPNTGSTVRDPELGAKDFAEELQNNSQIALWSLLRVNSSLYLVAPLTIRYSRHAMSGTQFVIRNTESSNFFGA